MALHPGAPGADGVGTASDPDRPRPAGKENPHSGLHAAQGMGFGSPRGNPRGGGVFRAARTYSEVGAGYPGMKGLQGSLL